MSPNVKDVLQAPILRFDTLDSTNNRAAQMIDADKSVPGLTIITKEQTAGKGQRGNTWKDEPGQSLLMSVVLKPQVPVEAQFSFSASIAVAVASVLQDLAPFLAVRIKFPNDIIINDKKAAGILVENSLRGNLWTHAIVGTGINVHQRNFDGLPNATSLFLAAQKEFDTEMLMQLLRAKIIEYTHGDKLDAYITRYNELLYKRGQKQIFSKEGEVFEALILGVGVSGQLELELSDGSTVAYPHGILGWVW